MNIKTTFISGIRYSHIFSYSKFSDNFYEFPFNEIELNTGALNGSLGITYRPHRTWQFNLSLASGFRAPNIDDIAKVFDSEPGNVVVPNSNLKPEYTYNIDFGIIKKLSDKTHFEITSFYTYMIDAMVRRDFLFDGQDSIMYDGVLSKVQAIVNSDEAYIYGTNISLSIGFARYFTFRSNIVYIYGEDNDNITLRHVTPLFGSTHLIYNTKKLNIDFFSDYNGEKPFSEFSLSEQDKPHLYAADENGNPYSPAWFTLNLKASYQINSYLQLNAGVENILDKYYRPYSSGISAPGRNFIFAVRVNF